MKFFKGSEERLAEDWVYEKVAEEIERNELRKGLWLKASSEALGDDKKARAIYVKLRVRQFVDELELAAKAEQDRRQQAFHEAQHRAEQQKARVQSAKERARSERHRHSTKKERPMDDDERHFALLVGSMLIGSIILITIMVNLR